MKNITLKLIILVFSLTVFLPLANAQQSWQASPERVEFLSRTKPGFNFDEEKVQAYVLPDVLATGKNQKITNRKDWEKLRRPELIELFASQVFGRIPQTPFQLSFVTVREDAKAMNGAATLKLIDILIAADEKSLTIHLVLFIPNQVKKPVPAFLFNSYRPAEQDIDYTRKNKSEYWPAEEIIARGYAAAAFFNGDVDPDSFDNFQNGIHGVLDKTRNNESWGTIAAWAWGASRCMDYLVTDRSIISNKIALIGHSRGAKTALWAGANDQRFAMICCNEAGCGGSALAHRRFGETITTITKSFPHWFCSNYKQYGGHENEMPFDMHELMALIAPRPLYITAASDDLWGDPKGQYLSLYYAQPVYQLYDKKINLSESMPPLNIPVRSKQLAYFIRSGLHDLTLKDWNFFMDQADLVLRK